MLQPSFQDGLIWVIAQEFGDGRLIGFYSDDLGTSWRYASGGGSTVSNGYILDYGSNSNRLQNLSSCVHEGRAKIIGHNTNSVWSLALGGYSSFSYPARADNPSSTSISYGRALISRLCYLLHLPSTLQPERELNL